MALKQNLKSKKLSKNLRNVLAFPKNSFWPLLEEPDNSLVNLLEDSMKLLKTVRPLLKGNGVQKLTKEERKKKIEEYFLSLPSDVLDSHKKAQTLKKHITIGLNDTVKALEKNELACCLAFSETKPKILIAHLADLAKVKAVPIILLANLKQLLEKSLGFSSLALGLKKELLLDPMNALHEVCLTIIKLFEENFKYEIETPNPKEEEDNLPPNILFEMDEKSSDFEKYFSEMTEPTCQSKIYLYRDSTNSRVFMPNEFFSSKYKEKQTPVSSEEASTSSEGEIEIRSKKTRYYEPPIILKVQPNQIKKHKFKNKKQR